MSIRTRMAFVVVLILLGCVFAAPYYRAQVAKQSDNDAGSSLPTLQIQRPQPAAPTLEVTDIEANTIAPLKSEVAAATRSRFSTQPELAPIPALEMPPAFVSARPQIASKPTPQSVMAPVTTAEQQRNAQVAPPQTQDRASDRSQTTATMRPVSLNGNDIGAEFESPQTQRTRTTTTGTLRPVAPSTRASMRQPAEMQRLDNRHFATGQFRSFKNDATSNDQLPFESTRAGGRQTDTQSKANSRRMTTSSRFVAPTEPRGRNLFQQETDRGSIEERKSPQRPFPSDAPSSTTAEKTRHRIVNGDTLERLSIKYFGSAEYAIAIFEANRDQLVSPVILPLGKELVIPKQPRRQPSRDRSAFNRSARRIPESLQVEPPPSRFGNSGWRTSPIPPDRISGL